MSYESYPNPEQPLDSGEMQTSGEEWLRIATQCEAILGGPEGKKLSQKTWLPDDQTNALARLGMSYGMTMVLARVGQTEPTVGTLYELTATSRGFSASFHFCPYIDKPFGVMTGDQPRLVSPDDLPQARTNMLIDYLQTYLGEDDG